MRRSILLTKKLTAKLGIKNKRLWADGDEASTAQVLLSHKMLFCPEPNQVMIIEYIYVVTYN